MEGPEFVGPDTFSLIQWRPKCIQARSSKFWASSKKFTWSRIAKAVKQALACGYSPLHKRRQRASCESTPAPFPSNRDRPVPSQPPPLLHGSTLVSAAGRPHAIAPACAREGGRSRTPNPRRQKGAHGSPARARTRRRFGIAGASGVAWQIGNGEHPRIQIRILPPHARWLGAGG